MKEAIRALHEGDIKGFFESLGLLLALENGKLVCDVCREPLTLSSFWAAARVGGELVFSCSKPACHMTFVLKTRRR
jgi:hypothetical protein